MTFSLSLPSFQGLLCDVAAGDEDDGGGSGVRVASEKWAKREKARRRALGTEIFVDGVDGADERYVEGGRENLVQRQVHGKLDTLYSRLHAWYCP